MEVDDEATSADEFVVPDALLEVTAEMRARREAAVNKNTSASTKLVEKKLEAHLLKSGMELPAVYKVPPQQLDPLLCKFMDTWRDTTTGKLLEPGTIQT